MIFHSKLTGSGVAGGGAVLAVLQSRPYFEFNVEIYRPSFCRQLSLSAKHLTRYIDREISTGRQH